jgi:hypothetical protein
MAGAGFRTFAVNEVLTANNVQNYLMDQSVMVFASTVARDAAIGAATDGMVAYTTDTGTVWRYNGLSWLPWSQMPTAYTPTLGGASLSSGALVYSINSNVMTIHGRLFITSVTGLITFTMPSGFTINTTATPATSVVGSALFTDAATANYSGTARVNTSTVIDVQAHNAAGTYTVSTNTSATIPFTWGAGDYFSVDVRVPLG